MDVITEEQLNLLICRVSGEPVPDPLPDLDAPLGDENLDSLACIELSACLSRDFGYQLSDDAITSETTRRTILALSPAKAGDPPSRAADAFRVELQMEIHPGRQADFESAWLAVGEAVTSHPANLGQELLRDLEEPTRYYITSDWTDEEAFRAFERSDVHLRHRQALHPYRAAGPMRVMRKVLQLVPTSAPTADQTAPDRD